MFASFRSENGCTHSVAHFGLELSMVFEGTTREYERIYRFNE